MRVLGLFCLILGLFCLTLGLFCLILGLVCFTLGLFCLILGLFCLIMGLFCQVRVVSLHPPRVLATLSANADDAALIHTSPDSLLPVLSSLLREPAPHSRPLFSALLSLSSLFVSHPSLPSPSPLSLSLTPHSPLFLPLERVVRERERGRGIGYSCGEREIHSKWN